MCPPERIEPEPGQRATCRRAAIRGGGHRNGRVRKRGRSRSGSTQVTAGGPRMGTWRSDREVGPSAVQAAARSALGSGAVSIGGNGTACSTVLHAWQRSKACPSPSSAPDSDAVSAWTWSGCASTARRCSWCCQACCSWCRIGPTCIAPIAMQQATAPIVCALPSFILNAGSVRQDSLPRIRPSPFHADGVAASAGEMH